MQITESDFFHYFNSIITKGKKDNTYKFALARFLVDYSYALDEAHVIHNVADKKTVPINLSVIAKAFLKYYWHQICKYKIKQNYNTERLPLIVQVMHGVFGKKYIPESFESMPKEKIADAEKEILRRCFLEVIPRFQNIPEGIKVSSMKIFYEHDKHAIYVKPTALKFFKDNYSLLSKAIILEWARFLEKINLGLPMLISKIESSDGYRGSLGKVKLILLKNNDTCFYCDNTLSPEKQMIHVDHFIPWSYLFEDELWNLVLACRGCNLKKHSSLP
ncbi:MAG TPA: HNH endonuclease domain-containing protein, partial [Phototrophicaceae bacterium]|nr:HNH endonuclease domain-containing protein [Phototrophicaceae bacterium]